MTRPHARRPSPASHLFDDDEPVLQSHPVIEGVPVPRFGDRERWAFHAHRRPANTPRSNWEALFRGLNPAWNLRTREVLMILLNPEHPAVAAGMVPLEPDPMGVRTAIGYHHQLRLIAAHAAERGLPDDLRAWDIDDAREMIERRRGQVAPGTLTYDVQALKYLHRLGPLLTGGALAADPWPGRTAPAVAGWLGKRAAVGTPNIAPEVWFALVRAAHAYVHAFAPDVLRARDHYRHLLDTAQPHRRGAEARIDALLADPTARIPVHGIYARLGGREHPGPGSVNWNLLKLMVGIQPAKFPMKNNEETRRIRAKVRAAVDAARGAPGGLLDTYVQVTRPDGTVAAWHPGLGPGDLSAELFAVRNACYVLIAAMSMMRDSEIREITRGSVVEHYGASAVESVKRKLDPDLPRERWWIADPVAEAIAVAEAVSWHPELIFPTASSALLDIRSQQSGDAFHSDDIVRTFIAYVNQNTAHTGLSIPPGSASPQQFRKTMSMLVATEPGGEIAVGHQLKHVASRVLANRVTQGYWASDAAWAKELDVALDTVRIDRLGDLFDQYRSGQRVGYGPAGERLTATFDAVHEAAERMRSTGRARHGDSRLERDLLRKAGISIRFGKLNHCLLDERNPVGAKCLEAAVGLPEGHRGPLQDRCQPGRCANSMIGPEHLPPWQAERVSLLTLLESPKLSPCQRGALERQLEDVDTVIERTAS